MKIGKSNCHKKKVYTRIVTSLKRRKINYNMHRIKKILKNIVKER